MRHLILQPCQSVDKLAEIPVRPVLYKACQRYCEWGKLLFRHSHDVENSSIGRGRTQKPFWIGTKRLRRGDRPSTDDVFRGLGDGADGVKRESQC